MCSASPLLCTYATDRLYSKEGRRHCSGSSARSDHLSPGQWQDQGKAGKDTLKQYWNRILMWSKDSSRTHGPVFWA